MSNVLINTGISLPSRKIWAEKFLQAKRYVSFLTLVLMFSTGQPSRFEKRLDNSNCYASFAASHVVDDEYIYVGQDISDRKNLEEELTKVKQYKWFFLIVCRVKNNSKQQFKQEQFNYKKHYK